MLSNKNLHIVVLLLLLPVYLYGQEYRRGQYEDLDLYYSLLEAEKRDSTYHKALARWQNSQPDQNKPASLPVTIKNKGLQAEYRFIISMPQQSEEEVRAKTDALMSLGTQAASQNEPALEADALSRAFMLAFWQQPQDYHKAFTIVFMLKDRLPEVAEEEFPGKRRTYFRLGEAYYLFLDFHKSIELLEKALAPTPLSFDDRANLDALKILGICYVNIGEWEKSDQYFRGTLQSGDIVFDRPYYNAYAVSHLACNAMLTGHYDKALALSAAVWETLKETGDNGHLAGMCYCRGRSYLKKGDFKQVSPWVDSLVYFANRDQYNPLKRIKQSYALRADYFTAMGDARLAQAYNDTLIGLYKTEEAEFTSQYIAKAAQDYRDSKITEHVRRLKTIRTQLALISGFALFVTLVSGVIIYLYRRNKAAYKALVLRAQEWAASDCPPKVKEQSGTKITETENNEENENSQITAQDRDIISRIHEEMTVGSIYRDSNLTAESLAGRLGIHRNTLSRVINRTTGGNFNQYVNSFRIKEAVRIISGTNHKDLYVDEIYERVGFNNRTSFYRVFKQMTGLSPRELQNNG